MNIHSIVNKINVFRIRYILDLQILLVSLRLGCQTKSLIMNYYPMHAYTIIRKDHGSWGGGVMFAIKSCKYFQVLLTPPSVEVLTVNVGLTTPTVYCLTYIPPNASADYQQDFLDYF